MPYILEVSPHLSAEALVERFKSSKDGDELCSRRRSTTSRSTHPNAQPRCARPRLAAALPAQKLTPHAKRAVNPESASEPSSPNPTGVSALYPTSTLGTIRTWCFTGMGNASPAPK